MGYLLGDRDYEGFLDGGCLVKVLEGLFVERQDVVLTPDELSSCYSQVGDFTKFCHAFG